MEADSISKLSDLAFKEIAYNEFIVNNQNSQTDQLINQKSSYLGCILRKDKNRKFDEEKKVYTEYSYTGCQWILVHGSGKAYLNK